MGQISEKTEEIRIKSLSEKGAHLKASFLPRMGMNLISFQKNGKEILDISTRPMLEERYAGLGAMIGPHFHHRKPEDIPKVRDESLFPHIAIQKARGVTEPFSHGIGRYAPWKVVSVKDSYLKAELKGTDLWNGIPLRELEGQDFQMEYEASMIPQGLEIHLSVTSEKNSVVGLHTYYGLQEGVGVVKSRVQNNYNDHGVMQEVPTKWKNENDQIEIKLDQDLDFGFYPAQDPSEGSILLQTGDRQVQVQYWCSNEDNSWQLWHPKGKSFVCIEPLSAKDPRNPRQNQSGIKILISIL